MINSLINKYHRKMKILFTILLAFSASVFYSQAKFDFEAEYEKATILSHKNLDSSETVLNSIIAQAKEGKEYESKIGKENN